MARPVKKGLDYFPFDTDFFHDIKICKLLRAAGPESVAVLIDLYGMIYHQGYFMKWDGDMAFIVSEDVKVDEDVVEAVVAKALDLGLFEKSLFDEHGVLSSKSIQRRYFASASMAKRNCVMTDFLLIEIPDKPAKANKKGKKAEYGVSDEIKLEETPVCMDAMEVNTEETTDKTQETLIKTELTAQKKEKEIKENKIEIIENHKKSEDNAKTKSKPESNEEKGEPNNVEKKGMSSKKDGFEEDLYFEFRKKFKSADESQWLVKVADCFDFTSDDMDCIIDEFFRHCFKNDIKEWAQGFSGCKKHFCRWLDQKIVREEPKANAASTDPIAKALWDRKKRRSHLRQQQEMRQAYLERKREEEERKRNKEILAQKVREMNYDPEKVSYYQALKLKEKEEEMEKQMKVSEKNNDREIC